MLSVKDLRTRYGRIEALYGIDLEVNAGEIVTVVGANGAGKTTLLRCLSGVQPASSGSISFQGDEITRIAPHRRVVRGLAQSPEGRQIFTNLSVEDNLRLGAYIHDDNHFHQHREEVFAMFPVLKQKRTHMAGSLSGGQQQMLAIARALMSRPSCLLLDEPSMGLAPILVSHVLDAVKSMKSLGVTLLLVEQNAHAALSIADRAYVMETGKITMSGPAGELISHPRVREAYLGL